MTNAGTADSYLLCNELTVSDSATVKADYIIISAFTWPSTATVNGITHKGERPLFETWASQASNADRIESGVLTQTGGTIHASKFIGGAYGATLNISGGVLNSSAIGTIDAIFGYATLIPSVNQEQVYRYTINAFDCSSTVNITGGTVNISENGYLGGHNSTVRISGGEVKLGANATMGMTDDQLTQAKNDITSTYGTPSMTEKQKRTLFKRYITGSATIIGGTVDGADAAINQPYTTVAISGIGTAVNVKDLMAVEGSITIQNATGTYDIPTYTTPKAGVYVADTMTAQNITISNQAMVYAEQATVDIPDSESGCLKVTSTAGDTCLYVSAFGASGLGAGESSTDVVLDVSSGNKNLFYVRKVVPIYYHLNGDETDPVTNNPSNRSEYTQEFNAEPLQLGAPTRHGYDFDGWYADGEFTTVIPSIDKSNSNPVHLYAKWIPKKVTFQIIIDATSGVANLSDIPKTLGSYNAESEIFTYSKTFTLDYGTQLQGGTGIDLELLNLPVYQILSIEIMDSRYEGDVHVDTNTIIGAAILDCYLKDVVEKATPVPFTLHVKSVHMRRANIHFYLNQSQINPTDAVFVSSAGADFQNSNTRASWVSFGDAIGTGNGLDGLSAKATGYTFLGWCSEQYPGENPEYLDLSTILNSDMSTDYYAVWKANEYPVTFSAGEGGMITNSSDAPETHDSTRGTTDSTVTYDSAFGTLPYAWKQGYVFLGWYVGDTKIKEDTILNVLNFSDYDNLTVEAKFEPVKVTYYMMGGDWANGVTALVSPGWGIKLPGYEDATGTIHSTAAEGFNGTFDTNDYRNILGRKGYTFEGWYLRENDMDSKVTTILPYAHMEVYAAWSANTYTLKLNPKKVDMSYDYTSFSHSDVKTATVTVGELITGDGVSEWPDRTNESGNWYVVNNSGNEGNRRYLLGFTFDALDPGGTQEAAKEIYKEYALMVTFLRNAENTMMEKGQSVFYLPEAYPVADVVIPDYPDGSTIEMYAVYRERSLVFIEYYTDVNNQVQQKEMYATDYSVYNDYPYARYTADEASSYLKLTKNGYSLIGWRFLSPTVDGLEYPNTTADYTAELMMKWVEKATAAGHYDLRVYTVYAAQAKTKLPLKANESPLLSNPVDTYIYSLPGSMQNGSISISVSDAGNINLVQSNELQLYSTSQTSSGTSDNTVAIGVKLIDTQGAEYDLGYLTKNGTTNPTTMQPGAGWKIKFELYTTKVITKEQDLSLEVTVNYTGNLSSQWIMFDDLTVAMVPTQYSVTYDANLPNDQDCKVENWNEYDEKTHKYTVQVGYGNPLTDVVPEVEGYTASTWYQTDADGNRIPNQSGSAFGGNLTFPVSATDGGKIYVETEWTANKYQFNVPQTVLDHWKITYTPLNLNSNENEQPVEVTGNTGIPYHATVYFTPKDNDPAEFVRLKSDSVDSTLDRLEGFDVMNGVSILMGAEDMTVSYETKRTLYLEDGTIDIIDRGYTQNGKFVTWRGDYVILMDEDNNTDGSSTENVLNLNGNFADRTIQLGSLNITSDNSITLPDNTTAELTPWENMDNIVAKNIFVPESASLTMNDLNLTLTPDVGNAAIGGDISNKANGAITLKNVTVAMTLPAGSHASGIGAATDAAEGKAITLTDCMVTATQKSTSAGHYHGAWIGGKNVATVSLKNTMVKQGAGSSNHTSAYAVNAEDVTIMNSTIGGANSGIATPLHAMNTLTLEDSTVYQSVDTIAAAPIGTNVGGEIKITNTKVKTVRNSGTGDLYTGTMMIMDAASEVVIDNTLILEMTNGDITIDTSVASQDSTAHNFAGKYLLLEERGDSAGITVNTNATITVKAPASGGAFQVDLLSVNSNTNLVLDGSTTMSVNTVSIASEKKLTVTGNSGTVQLAANALKDSEGTYSQIGGNLTSADEISGKMMDVILDGVTVNSTGLIAENLTLIDSTVNCGTGEVGSYGSTGNGTDFTTTPPTTVKLVGNTTVAAATVGALGKQNETFTFVEMSDTATVTGNLVRDWYRITYNVPNGATAPVQTVFRTKNDDAVPNSVPDKPTNMEGFNVWYYLTTDGKAIALSKADATVPGYADNDELRADLIDLAVDTAPADTTKTLTLYAGVKFKGDAAVKAGRLFCDFMTRGDGTSITIPANGVFTAQFNIEGTVAAESYYQFAFDKSIPAGTKLTLTVISDNTTKYYSYVVVSETDVIKVNDFEEMGKGASPDLPAESHINTLDSQTFILAMDFSDTAGVTVGNTSIQVKYCVDQNELPIDGAKVTYTLSVVNNGSIVADATSVTVTFPTSSVYQNEKLVLVAKIEGELPADVKASLNDDAIKGTPIQGGLVFPIDEGGSYTYTIEGMDSSYTITWALMLREDGTNVRGTLLTESQSSVQVLVTTETPVLNITVDSIDNDALSINTRTLQQGVAHTVVLSVIEKTNPDFEMFAEIQSESLADFAPCNKITLSGGANDKITVSFPETLGEGVYRICFSLKEDSKNDNVYFTFVVVK